MKACQESLTDTFLHVFGSSFVDYFESEYRAVRTENIYNAKVGISDRNQYPGVNVPNSAGNVPNPAGINAPISNFVGPLRQFSFSGIQDPVGKCQKQPC